jgi:hypothetical protein
VPLTKGINREKKNSTQNQNYYDKNQSASQLKISMNIMIAKEFKYVLLQSSPIYCGDALFCDW